MTCITKALKRQQAAWMKAAASCRGPRCCALLVAGCFIAAVAPVLAWYVERVRDRSDEPLGVIALAAAVVLVAMRSGDEKWRAQVRLRPAWMLGGAVLLRVIQGTGLSHFPLISGLIAVAILGVSVKMPGRPGVLALLVLSLPLVASLDFYAGYPLRLAATHVAVWLLNLMGLSVERVGVIIMDGGSVVGMDPPCAGVRMLWTTCFTAAVIAAQRQFTGSRLMFLLLGAVVCVVLGNSLRATLVFFPESGRVHWPAWMHPGIGLAIHGGVLAGVFFLGDWMERKGAWKRKRREFIELREQACSDPTGRDGSLGCASLRGRSANVVWLAGLVCVVGAGLFTWTMMNDAHPARDAKMSGAWPATMDGRPLVILPLSAREGRFAQAFPGEIAKFLCGDVELILRRVTSATRFMHPSGDCLRAEGFAVTSKPIYVDADGRYWGCSLAEQGGQSWRVLERYVNADGTRVCTDASAWFWTAVLHPGEGPWMAVTVRERAPDSGAVVAAR